MTVRTKRTGAGPILTGRRDRQALQSRGFIVETSARVFGPEASRRASRAPAFRVLTGIDLGFGLLAGVVSCLTPESLLLLPLVIAAAGAANRGGPMAIAVGLGLSLVLTGTLTGSFGALFGYEAIWFRRAVCVLLVMHGFILLSAVSVERFPLLTGGLDNGLGESGTRAGGGMFRLMSLAFLVGANWVPRIGPTLGKASLMAADARNSGLAFGMIFAFGIGAGMPWIVLGRISGLVLRPVMSGMAGKRLLGLMLLLAAAVGASGLEAAALQTLDEMLPAWTGKLATTF